MTGWRAFAAGGLVVATAWAGLVAADHDPYGPRVPRSTTSPRGQCPTEDSCTISYSGGQWHIVEVTP